MKPEKTNIQVKKEISRSERGQSLVELALTFTILMALVAGVIDFGRAFFTWVALRDAAQEGALYGSTNPTDLVGIDERVRDTSYQPVDMTDPAVVLVDITIYGPSCLGSPIQVDVTYTDFPITMPFLGTIIGSQTLTIHAKVTDTILRPTCGG
jgi:Flp pilus assembly protein TadG